MQPSIPPDRLAKGRYWGRAWSLVEGCTHCSPGCDRCWSAAATHMRRKNPNPIIRARMDGLTNVTGAFNGTIRLRKDNLDLPCRTRKPTVFAVWNDLFHEAVPEEFQREAFAAMQASSWRHIFLVLTKRPHIMAARVRSNPNWLRVADHIWWGCTVCNQAEVDVKLPHLTTIPGNLWVSYEPALGAVNFAPWLTSDDPMRHALGWIVCGGETGRSARMMSNRWAADMEQQCDEYDVPFFMKQWGTARDHIQKWLIHPSLRQLPWEVAHA
jgi:protein gp37